MKKIEFVKPVYTLNEIPKRNLPTVVLCGRSNVGKSSFINSIFSPLKVAKTSSTPGKTRSLNYYLVENKFFIVDLPGYGYAKVSKAERDKWQHLIENYFRMNNQIHLAVHIIDSRHEPTLLDIELNHLLRGMGIAYCVVLNKIDKLKQSELVAAKRTAIKFFPELIEGENLYLFSAHNATGKREIINLLSRLFL